MRGSKPGERRGGRRAGTPNKVTKELRVMVLEALDRAGGVAYLTKQAHANPTAFLSLVGKLLPREIQPEENRRLTLGELIEASYARLEEPPVLGDARPERAVCVAFPAQLAAPK
jgi:hypothetical protein